MSKSKSKKTKKENKEEKFSLTKKQERQLKIAVLFMLILIAFIVISYIISIERRKFEYLGIDFIKIKQGKTIFNLGSMEINGVRINVYFREDPRKLEKINILDRIDLKENVAIAVDMKELECEDNILAVTTLGRFLDVAFPEKRFVVATTNITLAGEKNLPYVTCEKPIGSSVIVFEKGKENTIYKKNDCYILEIANCEIMNVTERFMIGIYANLNSENSAWNSLAVQNQ